MLRIVDKNEYIETLKWLNDSEIETTFKPELAKRKNHDSYVFIKMEAEDGSNSLQAMASVEIYGTTKGKVALFNTLFVMPECRGNNYGKIIIYHLMDYLESNIENLYSFMVTCNKESYNSFIENGFKNSTPNKKSFRLYKESSKIIGEEVC